MCILAFPSDVNTWVETACVCHYRCCFPLMCVCVCVLSSTKGPQIAYERSFRWKLAHFRYLCQVTLAQLFNTHESQCASLFQTHVSVFAVQRSRQPREDHRVPTDAVWGLVPAGRETHTAEASDVTLSRVSECLIHGFFSLITVDHEL